MIYAKGILTIMSERGSDSYFTVVHFHPMRIAAVAIIVFAIGLCWRVRRTRIG